MAGIGFQLNKILAEQDYAGLMRAYGYAAVVSCGPWLLSVATLVGLGIALKNTLGEDQLNTFFVSVAHVFGFSLIITGPLQLILTRYAADQIYLGNEDRVFPAFASLFVLTLLFCGAVGGAGFMSFVPGPLLFRLASALLFLTVSGIWISVTLLTSVKNYNSVLMTFGIGYSTSFLCGWYFAEDYGQTGIMSGFLIGQIILLLVFTSMIYYAHRSKFRWNYEVFGYFRKYLALLLCGLFYNLGVWIDKFVFWWFSPISLKIGGVLYAAPSYDVATYFSLLSIVPGITVFLLKLETQYSGQSEAFYKAILAKARYAEIAKTRGLLMGAFDEAISLLLKVQTGTTLILLIYADELMTFLGMGAVETGLFRVALVGAFFLVLFLSLLVVLFYLNRLRTAMWCCVAFVTVNTVVTSMNLVAGERWFGFGFVIAAMVGFSISACAVCLCHRHLDYHTFESQLRAT